MPNEIDKLVPGHYYSIVWKKSDHSGDSKLMQFVRYGDKDGFGERTLYFYETGSVPKEHHLREYNITSINGRRAR